VLAEERGMQDLPTWLRLADPVQIRIRLGNLFSPRRRSAAEEFFSRTRPVRQIIVVQSIHIVWIVAALGALWFVFAPELSKSSALGRGTVVLFWATRLGIERLYYDNGCDLPYRFTDGLLSLGSILVTFCFGRSGVGIL
jgi:hypothetical protein